MQVLLLAWNRQQILPREALWAAELFRCHFFKWLYCQIKGRDKKGPQNRAPLRCFFPKVQQASAVSDQQRCVTTLKYSKALKRSRRRDNTWRTRCHQHPPSSLRGPLWHLTATWQGQRHKRLLRLRRADPNETAFRRVLTTMSSFPTGSGAGAFAACLFT